MVDPFLKIPKSATVPHCLSATQFPVSLKEQVVATYLLQTWQAAGLPGDAPESKIADRELKIADREHEIDDREFKIADRELEIADRELKIAVRELKIAVRELKIAS